jgi:mRNA-degrading endonuclease RelE of RelBE toxin-antitoxin system
LIREKIRSVAAAPHDRHAQAKALGGAFKGLFRLRVGDWRVLYTLDDRKQVLSVVYVRKREDAYD